MEILLWKSSAIGLIYNAFIFFVIKSWKWNSRYSSNITEVESSCVLLILTMFGIRIVLKAKKQTLKVSSCEEPKRLHWILLLSTAVTEPLHCNNPACTSIKHTLFNVAYIFFPGICSCGFHFRFIINGWMRRTHGNKDDVLLIQIKLWNPRRRLLDRGAMGLERRYLC